MAQKIVEFKRRGTGGNAEKFQVSMEGGTPEKSLN
jgi:hypothetical protein